MKNQSWNEVLSVVVSTKAVSRVLLHGPPDTGKSTSAINAALSSNRECFRVQCSNQMGIEDLLGTWTLQDGKTVFVQGPIPLAMASGGVLLIDEFDRRNRGHDSIWHAVLDDSAIAEVRLPNGAVVKAADGFLAIATTNEKPESFTPALLRRFELKLYCGTVHPDAVKHLPHAAAALIHNWQKSKPIPPMAFEYSVSAFSALFRLTAKAGLSLDQAALLVFGEAQGKEVVSVMASNAKA